MRNSTVPKIAPEIVPVSSKTRRGTAPRACPEAQMNATVLFADNYARN
jgi:hypothetical protein